MRAVVQRVLHSHVEVNHAIVGKIDHGLTVLLGVTHQDSPQDARYLAEKIAGLRIFSDPNGKMNLSLQDTKGSLLAISQFTLYADCAKGRRPSFVNAASPDLAKPLYDLFCDSVRNLGIHVETGIFQADMQVTILNDGPVTILLDSSEASRRNPEA